jgi:hypothetical protein
MAALTLLPSYEVSYEGHNGISSPPDELLAVTREQIDIGATTKLHAQKHTRRGMKLGGEVGMVVSNIIWFSRLSARQYRAKYACLYHTQVAIEPL